ncbi:uncharacterized protein LOC134785490 [Penaeus indicus]|uniref:uncharacterized protein LOC134785490 n=1 Tax=Penaeus indicus TaxID=29960 RepID=UPI00300C550C
MEPPLLPLLFVLVAGSAAQLAVGPVSLADGGHVISYDEGPSPDNSLIRCPYDLQEGQQVIAVIWELLKEDKRAGSYKWRPGRGGTSEYRECVSRGVPRRGRVRLCVTVLMEELLASPPGGALAHLSGRAREAAGDPAPGGSPQTWGPGGAI